jgi:hypothetical protein
MYGNRQLKLGEVYVVSVINFFQFQFQFLGFSFQILHIVILVDQQTKVRLKKRADAEAILEISY